MSFEQDSVETSEEKFFSLLEEQATLVAESATFLRDALDARGDLAKARDDLKALEHKCDETTHNLFLALNHAVLRPQDRGSIARLARSLDDVVDYAYATLNHVVLYEVADYPDALVTGAGLLAEQAALLKDAVPALRKPAAREGLDKRIVDVHALENRADEVINEAKAALFKDDDLKRVLKMKDVYEYLEEATDKCEDAADVIRDVLVRHGA